MNSHIMIVSPLNQCKLVSGMGRGRPGFVSGNLNGVLDGAQIDLML